MATSAYYNWDAAGRPWKVARPIKALGDRLRAHGYVIYYLGNQSHQTADEPEDHTTFGVTGWPGKHPRGYVLALDIMPPRKGQRSKVDGKPLPSLQALGKQIRADKQAGHRGTAFVKYMNWEPKGDYTGPCWHDSWQPNHVRRASSDRGHIHLSGRTDFHTSSVADGYDPVARIRAAAAPAKPPPEEDMPTPEQVVDKLLTTRLGRGSRTVGMQLQDAAQAAALNRFAAESKLRDEALLAAVAGVDTATILARVNALAAELAERAEDEQQRDAELRALVEQGLDGTDDPAEVIRRIGALLAAGTTPDA